MPAPSFEFPGVKDVLQKYQQRAVRENADPLGYQYAPYGYAAMQLLAEAVEATKSLEQDNLASYIHAHSFKTVVGEVTFGPDGEWLTPRLLVSQFQNVEGNDIEQFRTIASKSFCGRRGSNRAICPILTRHRKNSCGVGPTTLFGSSALAL